MFNVLLNSTITKLTKGLSDATQGAIPPITPDQYTLDSEMKGKQYIYGGQLNFSYKITDYLAAAVGFRANYYDGYYRGHVIADNHATKGKLASLLLDVDQKGWGFTPIISLAFHQGPLTLTARYEFRTKISTKNDTNVLDADLNTTKMVTEPLTQLVVAGAITAAQAQAIGQGVSVTILPPMRMVLAHAMICLHCSRWLRAMSFHPSCVPPWSITSSTTRMPRWLTTARRS